MKTILTPLDFSSISKHVIDEAGAMARAVDGCVVLAHVVPPVPIATDYSLEWANYAAMSAEGVPAKIPFDRRLDGMSYMSLTAAAEKAADGRLAEYQESLRSKSIPSRVVRLAGNPIKAILNEARSAQADYIVIGSHGHTAFYDLVLGSTTSGVIKGAPCPVLVVPPTLRAAGGEKHANETASAEGK